MAAAVRTSPANNPVSQPSTKRKRAAEDVGRQVAEAKPGPGQEDDSYASILQLDADNQRTAQAALAEHIPYPDPTFDAGGLADFGGASPPQNLNTAHNQNMYPGAAPQPTTPSTENVKPNVGTKEWHQARKDSHKEVERRRREVINEGIANIAQIIHTGGDKNKGAILQRAHKEILDLKAKEQNFDQERQVLKVAIEELTKRNESLQASNRQAWNESNKWQERCRTLGGDFDDYDSHGPSFDEPTDLDALQS